MKFGGFGFFFLLSVFYLMRLFGWIRQPFYVKLYSILVNFSWCFFFSFGKIPLLETSSLFILI